MSKDFLSAIIERKEREVAARKRHWRAWASDSERFTRIPREPASAVIASRLARTGSQPRVVAEIKYASPSAGQIAERCRGSIEERARAYAEAGADAISVLADGPGFGGSVLDVRRAADATSIPILFKEFVIDPLQVALAEAVGAGMVLLIVRALPQPGALETLVAACERRGLVPLVEVFDLQDLRRAEEAGAEMIGVNARDLARFVVDETRAAAVVEAARQSARCVYWLSGVKSAADFVRIAHLGVDGILVGEALMRSADPTLTLREWRLAVDAGGGWR